MSETITQVVKKGYGAVAREGLSSENEGIANIAKAFGYSQAELNSIPAQANMGLSCGNPTAMASLQPGECVVDLGSGGGLDVFLAAAKVGAGGRAIGIDMTEDMVALARRNAEKSDYQNVEFHLAEISAMPLETNSVDCIISNCVLNLVEDKDAALQEIFRVLKPGGRLAISDIALKQELPKAVREDVAAWTACISGAISFDENHTKLIAAGFSGVIITDSGSDLNSYQEGGGDGCCAPVVDAKTQSSCCGSSVNDDAAKKTAYHDHMADLMENIDFNEFAASVKIFAIKPE
ncbi:MAG: arsenite methyltransferase [Rhizobiaceae bacterium]|nr:arsenite methyltransferase [Rhizobiaceae bacterium]